MRAEAIVSMSQSGWASYPDERALGAPENVTYRGQQFSPSGTCNLSATSVTTLACLPLSRSKGSYSSPMYFSDGRGDRFAGFKVVGDLLASCNPNIGFALHMTQEVA
ncbi:hypothetical protein IQ26_05315 [Mesorhizobium tianshanense]|uniref:Uncharacterized protein n=1 Tax=Mesorhizobium tianshanense TaxID=39844 RepID=A0A562N7X9_9HYPH|nr:hypothetical protein IQ26_05315 [Mesorhizobium tianshanense]